MRGLEYFCILIGLFMLISSSCEKEKIEADPAKAILGKWEVVEMGNWPNMERVEDSGYKEFLPDSILREYSYETGDFYYKKYWIDTLLYVAQKRDDGVQIITQQYHYYFFDKNNKLRLDHYEIAAIYNTFIYKRLN